MNNVAIKMLIGDRAKYLSLIFGISFATLLMSQQMSLFVGIMARTYSLISETKEADIWVMDPKVQYVDGVEPLPDMALAKVRSVAGVKWAVPFFKGSVVVKVKGALQAVTLVGVDDASFVGAPRKMVMGDVNDLKIKNGVIIDRLGYSYIWPGEPHKIGREFEANDQRMFLVGICDSVPSFSSPILMYSRYLEAVNYGAKSRNQMSFVLAKAKEGYDVKKIAREISKISGLKALSREEFSWETTRYMITHTGIAINFGVTVFLGFIIGTVISGQTFYIFVVENLRQFAALKAIGVSNKKILYMVLTQAAVVASIGYAIGIGLTSLFFKKVSVGTSVFKGFFLPWQVVAIVGLAVILIMIITSFISVRKVFNTDPALVFRG